MMEIKKLEDEIATLTRAIREHEGSLVTSAKRADRLALEYTIGVIRRLDRRLEERREELKALQPPPRDWSASADYWRAHGYAALAEACAAVAALDAKGCRAG